MSENLQALRMTYRKGALDESSVDPDPIVQFRSWFAQARNAGEIEANAMVVATVDADGAPSARVVLLKDIDGAGFVFFTNYESQKGRELQTNPRTALTFYWSTLERQVRITGSAVRTARHTSDDYFASRPVGSRIGAAVSPQSEVVRDRAWLEDRVARAQESVDRGGSIARPEFWGGYRVAPTAIEFWQGRPDRVHDRIRYRRDDGGWTIERLAP